MKNCEYFIKKDYIKNEQIEKESKELYWNKKRISDSYYYQYYVYNYAKKILLKNNCKEILDIGCGIGNKLIDMFHAFPENNFTGIDKEEAINICKKKINKIKWISTNFEKPINQIIENKFDMIICADVIEHLEKPEILLESIKSLMTKKGFFIISTPDRDRLRGTNCVSCPNKNHIREWSYDEFEKFVEYSEFEIIEHFRQIPGKVSFSKPFFNDLIYCIIKKINLKYNQVCLAKLKDR